MRRIAGHAFKAFAFLLVPLFVVLVAGTVKGWRGLASNPRLAAGWALLLGFAFVLPLFLSRVARAAIGHEPEQEARTVWRTGVAALLLGALALFVLPWRDLLQWVSTTLSNLTGVPVLAPEGSAR
jgi:hypothetical protein